MMARTQIRISALAFLALANPFMAARAEPSNVINRIVAVVDDKVITQSDVQEALKNWKDPSADRAQVIESIINTKVIQGEMDREKIEVMDKEVDEAVRNVLARNQTSLDNLKERLARQGLNFEQYKEELRQDLRRSQFLQKVVYPRIQVSDYDLQEYYKRHASEFQGFDQIRFFEIFVAPDSPEAVGNPKALAEKLSDRLSKGGNFQEIARKYSRGAFADRGGDSGLMATKDLRPDLLNVLSGLPLNVVSPPLPANNGIFIFKVVERKDPRQRAFNEVKELIRQRYIDERVQEETERYVMQARARHFIEIRP